MNTEFNVFLKLQNLIESIQWIQFDWILLLNFQSRVYYFVMNYPPDLSRSITFNPIQLFCEYISILDYTIIQSNPNGSANPIPIQSNEFCVLFIFKHKKKKRNHQVTKFYCPKRSGHLQTTTRVKAIQIAYSIILMNFIKL